MAQVKILWADDEIELLKPHVLFLKEKGYEVATTNSGDGALELIGNDDFDIIFLDENMPGLTGLETLSAIKNLKPNLPVVMITKSEEETIMEEAIGSNIADYLIKPVNPNQILLCLKKNLENKRLVSEKTAHAYQREFRSIGMDISPNLSPDKWKEIYRKLVYWELELEKSDDEGILEVLNMQKEEANTVFAKFIKNNYEDWLKGNTEDKPVQSHTLIKEKLFPLLDESPKTFLILIDNLRFDQWKIIQPLIEEYYRILEDDMYYSILPTATQYARNALFAGLLPAEIEKKYPAYWVNEADDEGKNKYENELMQEQLKRFGKAYKFNYHKVLNLNYGRKLYDNLSNLMNQPLNVIVYNFVDMLSHARTDMEIIRELADDEPAYRSLMLSWFEHSALFDILKFLAEKKVNVLLTTDHGSVRVFDPVKVKGDKNTSTNLRYKMGKSLGYDENDVYEVRNPLDIFLPRINVSSSFIFCRNNDFFAYPNNYNYYVNYYKNTFQHGGISMEEMLVPVISLKAR